MDWMGKCVGNRIEQAMAEAGVGQSELAHRIGISRLVFAARMAAPATFEAADLILIAATLDCPVQALLPDPRCSPDAHCATCRIEN
ncbi:hypothetical protein [Nocardia sp. NPDC020380]|uniref:hypothetical protein n=1 Tax=Nocardia sp. NPDC020380 TaxID=3364309 RepID=UPI003792366A